METQDGFECALSLLLAASLLGATSAGAAGATLSVVQEGQAICTVVMRGYGGHGIKVGLEDGKDYPGCSELGGETHACGAVALTPNYSFAVTLAGLNVREVQTGKLLWHSPGFAPRACVKPALATGRAFWTSGASGVLYCWEPVN